MVVQLIDIIVVQSSEDLGNGEDFGEGLFFGNRVSFSWPGKIVNDFPHELLDSLHHSGSVQWGNEEWVEWSFLHGWLLR